MSSSKKNDQKKDMDNQQQQTVAGGSQTTGPSTSQSTQPSTSTTSAAQTNATTNLQQHSNTTDSNEVRNDLDSTPRNSSNRKSNKRSGRGADSLFANVMGMAMGMNSNSNVTGASGGLAGGNDDDLNEDDEMNNMNMNFSRQKRDMNDRPRRAARFQDDEMVDDEEFEEEIENIMESGNGNSRRDLRSTLEVMLNNIRRDRDTSGPRRNRDRDSTRRTAQPQKDETGQDMPRDVDMEAVMDRLRNMLGSRMGNSSRRNTVPSANGPREPRGRFNRFGDVQSGFAAGERRMGGRSMRNGRQSQEDLTMDDEVMPERMMPRNGFQTPEDLELDDGWTPISRFGTRAGFFQDRKDGNNGNNTQTPVDGGKPGDGNNNNKESDPQIPHTPRPIRPFRPAVDFFEFDDHIRMFVDLPGGTIETTHVEMTDNGHKVIVSGELKMDLKDDDVRRTFMMERKIGKFSRTILVPVAIDVTKMEASMGNGVLQIRCAKIVPTNIQVPVKKTD
ncbi:hypothetical protein HDU76_003667 [Blyttiomyces sp. JEL0837]|nr:hypothetical protein HDU76_003667 [Blyttiomyces sp. JEL0837]